MFLYHIKRKGMPLSEGYIGITNNTSKRFSQHIRDSKSNGRSVRNRHLYNALNKYNDIEFVILEEGSDDYIKQREFELRPDVFIGWNQAVGGSHNGGNVWKGRKRPEHSKLMKSVGFQKGNRVGRVKPIMAEGIIFLNKRIASKFLNISEKTIYNRCKSCKDGYKFLRDEK